MKIQGTLIGAVSTILVSTICFAGQSNVGGGSIKAITQQSASLEKQIDERQRAANRSTDPAARQYRIGFKDGYNKSVLDLVKTELLPQSTQTSLPQSSQSMVVKSAVNYQKAASWVRDSYTRLKIADWETAIKNATVAIILDPWIASPYVNRSWANAESGLLDQAIADAGTALKIEPGNALAYNNRGFAKELAGRQADAKEDYNKACDLKLTKACDVLAVFAKNEAKRLPSDVALLLVKSFHSFKKRDWRAVEELTSKVLLLDPKNAIAYVNRAGARTELGYSVNAIEDTNKAIRIQPDLGIAYNNKGYAQERLGQLNMASHNYQRACRLGIQQSCKDFERIASTTKKK